VNIYLPPVLNLLIARKGAHEVAAQSQKPKQMLLALCSGGIEATELLFDMACCELIAGAEVSITELYSILFNVRTSTAS